MDATRRPKWQGQLARDVALDPVHEFGSGPQASLRVLQSFCRYVEPNRPRVSCAALRMKERISRAVIEIGFIVFLFYANLLMGEYERSGMGRIRGLAWAISDILTAPNLAIAITAALVGYVVFEFLRKSLP